MNKIIFALIFFNSFIIYSQEKLLCKEWIEDVKTNENKLSKNKMIFHENFKFEGYEEDFAITGNWKFDTKKKNIIITIDNFPTKINLKIIKLTDSIFVWSGRNFDDGNFKKVFMKSVLK